MSDLKNFKLLHALVMQFANFKADDIRGIISGIDYSTLRDFNDLQGALSLALGERKLVISEKSWNSALNIIEDNPRFGVESFYIDDPIYPSCLRQIDNPPIVLHTKGSLSCLNDLPGVAVVGTRKVSKNGEVIASRIASFLASQGWVVVSGLALGVDAAAHVGALSVNPLGNTVAVLAHGLEKAKPVKNAKIADDILEAGGLWVSEHPLKTNPQPFHFRERNRIQLGLSVGSVIVEAELKSGSMSQAQFCLKQKRPLFAVVPEDSTNSLGLNCEGTVALVNDFGAIPIKNRNDYPLLLDRLLKQKNMMLSIES